MDSYLAPWRKFADFGGRARRSEYWIFNLVNAACMVVLMLVFLPFSDSGELILIPAGIFAIAASIPTLAVTVRRLHDIGRSGWWYFIGMVPYVGGLILFVFSVLDSEPGTNEYGPSPKYGGDSFDPYEVADVFS